MSSGTIKLTAFGRMLRFGSHSPISETFASAVMDGIAEHLKVPSPLQLGVYGLATISSTQESLFPTFSSEFLVEFRKNGSVKKLSLTQQSLAPAVDEAIASAIYRADSSGLFPPIAEATNDSELKVFIDFDMTDVVSPGIIAGNRYPLFRATVPVYIQRLSKRRHWKQTLFPPIRNGFGANWLRVTSF